MSYSTQCLQKLKGHQQTTQEKNNITVLSTLYVCQVISERCWIKPAQRWVLRDHLSCHMCQGSKSQLSAVGHVPSWLILLTWVGSSMPCDPWAGRPRLEKARPLSFFSIHSASCSTELPIRNYPQHYRSTFLSLTLTPPIWHGGIRCIMYLFTRASCI